MVSLLQAAKNAEYQHMKDIRRELIGLPQDMREFATQILEAPGNVKGEREKSNGAFHENVTSRTGLCHDLENEMYREELYDLALEMGLPVTKKTSKKELLISYLPILFRSLYFLRSLHSPLRSEFRSLKKYVKNLAKFVKAVLYHNELSTHQCKSNRQNGLHISFTI